ncbi:MAG: alpha/beta hydrolase [Steroidobacteraceae bacterium]
MKLKILRNACIAAALATLCSGCAQLAFLAVNIPASFGNYSRLTDLRYGQAVRNTLDVYQPKHRDHAPVVIFIHGGGWNSGDKADYKFVGAALARAGYVTVLPNYSLYPQVKFPTFMMDAAAAVAWVKQHAAEWGGDPQHIYLMGHSAGAHIAMMLALNEQYLQQVGIRAADLRGVIGLSGPYDFLPFTFDYMNDLFGPSDRFALSQPINYVHAGAPPMLLMQGMQDKTVAPKNTVNLAKALTDVGVPVTVNYYPKASHSDLIAAFSIPARGRVPALSEVQRFIQLREQSAAP